MARADAHHGHGGIVAGFAFIQAVALVHDVARDVLGGIARQIVGLREIDDVFALPAVVERVAHARVGRAVAHGDEHVVFFHGEAALVDRFAGDLPRGHGIIVAHAAAQHDDLRVVELDQLGDFVVRDADDRERGVGHFAHAAHGQRFGDGFHAAFNRHAAGDHRAQDFGSQGGKNVRFDAAAKAVREHERGVVGFAAAGDFHPVAAQLLAGFVQAHIARFRPQIIHAGSHPSAL